MLNLKKGLAMVLAAATALTFAPVTSFAAVSATDDGIVSKTGIDSIDFSDVKLEAGKSTEIFLKEHNDTVGGQKVVGYRVTVSRVAVKDKVNTYNDLVELTTENNSSERDKTLNSTVTASAVTQDTSWGTVTQNNEGPIKQSIWQITNEPGVADTDDTSGRETVTDRGMYHVNGAYFTLTATNAATLKTLTSATTTVKVEALARLDKNAEALETSTFNVSVYTDGVKIQLQAPDKYIGEGDTVDFPVRVINNTNAGTIKSLRATYDDQSSSEFGSIKNIHEFDTKLSAGKDAAGDLTFEAGTQGTVKVTIYGVGTDANGDTSDSVASATFTMIVTPGNGKLRVRYTRKSDGQTFTYTDDAETKGSAISGISTAYSSVEDTVNDGVFNDSARLIKSQRNDAAYTTNQASEKNSEYETVINGTGTGKKNDEGLLPAAQTLVNGSNAEFDITASSDVDAKITYAIVAPVSFTDANISAGVDAAGDSTTLNNDKTAKTYDYNALTGAYTGSTNNTGDGWQKDLVSGNNKLVKIASKLGNGDYYTYTTAAAEKYGAVDQNGHVTLKSSAINVPLYVVITAEGAKATSTSAARKTSTYIVPVGTADQAPLQFYAGAGDGYAEIDANEISNQSVEAGTYKNHKLYLNVGQSDTVKIATNAGKAYVTGSSSDDTVATYVDGVITGKKVGNCTITLKTSSSPAVSGLITAKINVVVDTDKTGNTLTLSQDTNVTKETSRSRVSAKAGVSGSQVLFDTDNLYTPDSTRPNGFRRIKSKEAGYQDITVSASGYVTYEKNAGTVYVRAYAKADGYHPTGYVYAKVTYGSQDLGATDNTLSVDKKSVVVKPGETVKINATSNTGITVASDDSAIATATNSSTVATAAAITVTGVKQGNTTIKVSAAADTKANVKSAEIEIPVVVTDANGNVADDVKTPAKVTGVKVKNVKGGKVTVTWKKQNQKNIKYYVKKTVGKKSAGKSVNGGKTTLSVKKGATVKVKVKAYIYNASGKKLVGKYSKTVTLKTDKK